MGYAKRMQEERERLQDIAATLLKETRFLVPCEFHDTLIAKGDEECVQNAYKLGNHRVTSGAIELDYGLTRRDLTDAIKEVAETAPDECYDCRKMAEE
jgi:hypothetical protein